MMAYPKLTWPNLTIFSACFLVTCGDQLDFHYVRLLFCKHQGIFRRNAFKQKKNKNFRKLNCFDFSLNNYRIKI
jgi:hypothetical protein